MKALVKRGVRSGLCAADTPNLTELIESSDDALCNRILCNQDHIQTSYSLFFLTKEILPIISENETTTDFQPLSRVVCAVVILSLECCSKPVIDFVRTSFHSRYFSLIYMYYCVIVAFCQRVLNEHAMLCYVTTNSLSYATRGLRRLFARAAGRCRGLLPTVIINKFLKLHSLKKFSRATRLTTHN